MQELSVASLSGQLCSLCQYACQFSFMGGIVGIFVNETGALGGSPEATETTPRIQHVMQLSLGNSLMNMEINGRIVVPFKLGLRAGVSESELDCTIHWQNLSSYRIEVLSSSYSYKLIVLPFGLTSEIRAPQILQKFVFVRER